MAARKKASYNILLITVDQETFFDEVAGLDFQAHSRLRSEGVSFQRHYINAAICTPSRSVMFTGQHIPHTAMWDNTNFFWQQDMDPGIRTVGHLFREIGYYTVYKGKWHLARTVDPNPGDTCSSRIDSMEPYGFSDYSLSGDQHGDPLAGYYDDPAIAADAVRWLRTSGERLCSEGEPWFLTVNFINPHDIMLFDADPPGVYTMNESTPKQYLRRAPDCSLYRTAYPEFPVSTTTGQPLAEPGRPEAHARYQAVKDQMSGVIRGDAASWERYKDYYVNCIKDVDSHVSTLLNELDDLGMAENTIVVYTSDHGEMMGTHGIRGKGPFAYDENVHVPMFIRHPDIEGGQNCNSLSCHTDLVPTLLNLSGKPADQIETLTRDLPGHNLSRALTSPSTLKPDLFRPGVLFCFNMFYYLGTENQIENMQLGLKGRPVLPDDFSIRGHMRTVITEQYKFSRYFAPRDQHQPQTWDELVGRNDLELFDTLADPGEMENLAADPENYRPLILELNSLLNDLIAREIGVDDGYGYMGRSWCRPPV